MGVPVKTVSQAIRDFWSIRDAGKACPVRRASFDTNPAAQRAHDLDDPFFDGKVQTRMAEVILADSAQNGDPISERFVRDQIAPGPILS